MELTGWRLSTKSSISLLLIQWRFGEPKKKPINQRHFQVVIINVSHTYRVSELDFRRFFLHPLAMNAARNGVFLCDTLVDLRTISLEELLENNFR